MKYKHLFTLSVALACPVMGHADNPVFTDDFSNGSTLNGTSTPGGSSTASFTSYDIASTRAAVSGPAISSGDLRLSFDAATTSGFLEAQAIFTSTPITLSTVGDYIDLTVVFTDTGGTVLAGGSGSFVYNGLYNSAGSAPLAGSLANGGLTAASGSPYATGNAANWSGYVARIGTSFNGLQSTYRNPQTGAGTSSANQDLIGNNISAGAFNNPAGDTSSAGGAGIHLTADAQYTLNFRATLTAVGTISISDSLYSGAGLSGGLMTNYVSIFSGANFHNSFDGLAVGVRNATANLNPVFDINSINITDSIHVTPEPAALSCGVVGATVALLQRRRRARSS